MASFDIVNKVDPQLLDNAINITRKEIINRFDFNGSKSEITLDKKSMSILSITSCLLVVYVFISNLRIGYFYISTMRSFLYIFSIFLISKQNIEKHI